MSFENRRPLHYNLLALGDPMAIQAFQKQIDPENNVKKFQVVFQDSNIRNFYLKNFAKDLENVENTEKLYLAIVSYFDKFKHTGIFKNLSVSFEHDENQKELLKIIFTPQYTKKFGWRLNNLFLSDCGYFSAGSQLTFKLRNLGGMMDTLSLGTSFATYGAPKNNYFINYIVPSVYKDYNIELTLEKGNVGLSKNIVERYREQLLRWKNNSIHFALQHATRINYIDPTHHSKELLEQELIPSRKIAFSAEKIFQSGSENLQRASFVYGEIANVEKAGKHAKFSLTNALLWNPSFIKQKGKLSLLNLENLTAFGAILPFSRAKIRINDRFHQYPMKGFTEIANSEASYDPALHPQVGKPGFEFLTDNKGSDLYFQNTTKLNFNQCPLLRHVLIIPFIHLSYGYFSGDVMSKWFRSNPETTQTSSLKQRMIEEIKKKSRISVGVGVERKIGALNFEAMINLYTIGAPGDRTKTFQFRCAFF